MDVLAGLDHSQREAVCYGDGPLLVLAGAGSGKTRVIVHRIAYLMSDLGVPPEKILAVTFTNKASREMIERVEDLVGARPEGLWIGTFHSVCLRILRREGKRLGLPPGFTIYDRDDSLGLLKALARDIAPALNPSEVGRYLERISSLKAELTAPDEVDTGKGPGNRLLAELYASYQDGLAGNGALDFDDLIMKVVELLSRHPGVRDAYRARFSHLLVDEYQDTNYAQYRLLGLLAGEGTGLFVVGDDDQSIYGWRGADIRNILEFEEDFPESGSILLDVNYRSTGTILEAASRMIAHNEGRKPKVLRAEREEGEKIRLYRGRDDRGEARWVAGEIRKACVEEGFKYTDFAVLYRINAQSRVFEEVMREEGIPYRVIGTLGFYRRREIKDLIAFLKVIVNRSDSYSLLRIINVPPRGIGTRSIERLKGLAARHGTSLYEAMALSETDELLKGKRGEMLRSFRALLDDLVGLAGREGPGLMIREVLERTGYRGYLEEEDTKEALGRLENIDEFVRGADEFTLSWRRGGREASLADFLERTALMEETDASTGGPGGISLLTLHNAKGLEFPCVYIVGLEEGLLPWGGDGRPADGEDIEEERRLFYVGMTRAKTRLGLSYAFQRVNRGRMVHGRPSRFLGELPGELMSTDAPGVLYAASRHAGFEGGMGDESVDAAGSIHLDHFSNPSFRPGDRVYHDEFGSGVVLEVVGLGESLKLTVDFDCCGRKKLYPFYANVIREDG